MSIGGTEKNLGRIKNGYVTKTERSYSVEGCKSQGKSTACSTTIASSKKRQESEYGSKILDNASYESTQKKFS